MNPPHVEPCPTFGVKLLVAHQTCMITFLDIVGLKKMMFQMFDIEECLITFWTVLQPCSMVVMDSLNCSILLICKMVQHRYHGDIHKAAALSRTHPPLIFRYVLLKIVTFKF